MRMFAHALLALSLEAAASTALRSSAAAVATTAVEFMRASVAKEVQSVPGNVGASTATVGDRVVLLEGELHASAVALMSLKQLMMLFEELLVMLAREQRVAWQRALAAAAQTLCSHISSSHDALCVLLLLMYPPPSIDSFALLDVCFPRLLSVCPQVRVTAAAAADVVHAAAIAP